MRLTSEQRRIIRKRIRTALGTGARGYLFGSRLNDDARGGDIDLYIEVDTHLDNRAATASRLAAELQLALGDQRIDVLLVDPATTRQPIHDNARASGVVV